MFSTFFYHQITMFLDFISFLKKHAPFYELLIPALDVLLDLVEGSLELIDLPLAEKLAIVGAHLEAGLVLSYLFFCNSTTPD